MMAEKKRAFRTANEIAQERSATRNTDNPQTAADLKVAREKKAKSSQDELTTGNAPQADFPLIHRDANKNVIGVDLPNGDSFRGLDPEAVQKIVDNWNNQNAEPANSMYADVYKAKLAEQQAQAQAQGAKAQDKAALQQKGGELAKNVGMPSSDYLGDAEKARGLDITRLQDAKDNLLPPATIGGIFTGKNLQNLAVATLSESAGLIRKATGKPGALVFSTPSGKLKEYLNGYSLDGNLDLLDADVSRAQTLLGEAVDAANGATTAEAQMEAYTKYRIGVARIHLALTQVKQAGDRDPGNSRLRNKEEELMQYMDNLDLLNQKMRDALVNPNPNLILQKNAGETGVVANG